jgi:outer membrane lipoprotein-sorting protein
MIKAQGGIEVLKKINDTTLIGAYEMAGMSLSGTMIIYHKEPNKIRWEAEVRGRTMIQAFDGETAWTTHPQTGGAQEMSGKPAENFKRGALGRDTILNPKKLGITYTFQGKEKIDDKDYLVLEQAFSDGYQTALYVNPKTYLVYQTKRMGMNEMGLDVEEVTHVSDYKKVDGVMVAHSMIVYQGGKEFMRMTIEEVIFDSGLEDSLFSISE